MTLLAVTLLVPLLASINITLALTTMNTTVFIFYKIQIYIFSHSQPLKIIVD